MKLRIQKFNVKVSSIVLMIIILLITGMAYFLCTYYININELDMNKNIDNIVRLKTIKDILLVVISICGANLLLSLIIEVKTRNSLVTEILLNDVIASPEFYGKMDDDKKINMFKALEKQLYFKHNLNHSIFTNMREKIINMASDYYYESCSYDVTCNVCEDYIEKEITKKVVLKPYDKQFTIKEFSIGSCSSKKVEGLESYELTSLSINGDDINLKKDINRRTEKVRNLNKQNEYDTNIDYIYAKPLKITDKKENTIIVKCKTRTTIDDKSSTFRVAKPCKNFSLVYSVMQHDKYRIGVDAFGFLDDADDSTNNDAHSSVNISFNDWIFKYDGVVVVILDK